MSEKRYGRNQEDDNKLTIVALESCVGGGKPEVVAHFNPKELDIAKPVPWSKHSSSKTDEPILEFTGAEGRTLSFELLFDAYEANGTVATPLDNLSLMAKVKQEDGPENERRPPLLGVRHGPWGGDFRCVLESLSIKVTMFNASNAPVRATVTVKFKEVKDFAAKAAGAAGAR